MSFLSQLVKIMLTDNDIKNFTKAMKVASISDFQKTHVGCIAVYQSSVVGMGYNTNKTHPIQKHYNRYREFSEVLLPKLHAEINCINQIRHLNVNFSKVKLYIYRIRKDQPFGLAYPCPSCMAAIKDLGIKDIFYTSNTDYCYERISYEKGGVI